MNIPFRYWLLEYEKVRGTCPTVLFETRAFFFEKLLMRHLKDSFYVSLPTAMTFSQGCQFSSRQRGRRVPANNSGIFLLFSWQSERYGILF